MHSIISGPGSTGWWLRQWATPWWKSQNNLTGLWQNITTVYLDSPVSRTVWNVQLNTSNTFTLPGKFTAELTAF